MTYHEALAHALELVRRLPEDMRNELLAELVVAAFLVGSPPRADKSHAWGEEQPEEAGRILIDTLTLARLRPQP